MLSEAEDLVERMKADPLVNYLEDWKLLTFFVGGNDLCGSCEVSGKSISQSANQSVNQSISLSVNQSIRQSINQSIIK